MNQKPAEADGGRGFNFNNESRIESQIGNEPPFQPEHHDDPFRPHEDEDNNMHSNNPLSSPF